MDATGIAQAAEFLLHLRRQRRAVRALPHEIRPTTLDDAYAIQDEVHLQAGWPLEIYKVGFTGEAARAALGIPHPGGGRVPSEGCFDSGVTVSRSFFAGAPLIECELALRVAADGTIDAVAPAMELVNSRFSDISTVGAPSVIADNTAAAGVVLGSPVAIAEAGDLAEAQIALRDGAGAVLAAGSGSAVIGGPADSVRWTLAHEASRGRTVAGGRWIITGTCTGLTPTTFGTTYTADFGDLGAVSFTLGS